MTRKLRQALVTPWMCQSRKDHHHRWRA